VGEGRVEELREVVLDLVDCGWGVVRVRGGRAVLQQTVQRQRMYDMTDTDHDTAQDMRPPSVASIVRSISSTSSLHAARMTVPPRVRRALPFARAATPVVRWRSL
jgi:hypothetical protein